ncbi:MAG: membrane protein insertion efficiency factor YidD [Alphaproteobacteria bacterium]|nr:membrane protein insertion efficiency factor YidD [Alphaproteobacteria bacterium]
MTPGRYLTRLPAGLMIGAIAAYRTALSPLLGTNCRYEPSCACYGQEAIRRHGAVRGGWLTLHRLARCHPWGGMGYDPVPDASPAASPGHSAGSIR